MKKKAKSFELLPFNDKEAYKQVLSPKCQELVAKSRQAKTRADLEYLRRELREAGVEQGAWPVTIALDMKLSGNEEQAARISPEVRGVVLELFNCWRSI